MNFEYAQIREISGVKVISAVGQAPTDPQASRRAVKPLLERSNEYKTWNLYKTEQDKIRRGLVALNKEYLKSGAGDREAIKVAYAALLATEEPCAQKVAEAWRKLRDAEARLFNENKVASLPHGAVWLTEELRAKAKGVSPDSFLTLDGGEISTTELEKRRKKALSPAERNHELTQRKYAIAHKYSKMVNVEEMLGELEKAAELKVELKKEVADLEKEYV